MIIYKFKNYSYSTDDLFFDRVCEVKGVELYPVKARDYEEFLKYANYLIFSKKHLGIDKQKDFDLLNTIIMQMAMAKGSLEEEISTVLIELCNLFKILTHREINWQVSYENGYEFTSEDNSVLINKNNFESIRRTVLKMTLLKEPKIFEREIDRKWHEKAIKAREKNSPRLEFGEMVLLVSQDMKFTIEQVLELNIFQLRAYYGRIAQIYQSETTRLFATAFEGVKPSPFADSIFKELYDDHEEDLNITSGSLVDLLKN